MIVENANSSAVSFPEFLNQAKDSGGSELANYQIFVERLCNHLALPAPQFASEQNQLNDYVFERRIAFKHPDGSSTNGRIDLYKRDCFILEAKQSAKRKNLLPKDADQLALLPEDAKQHKPGQAKRGTRQWDKVMLSARKQAEDYARALPVEHGYPPFLLIVDVGNVIEVFADFSGQGKNYAHFPDRQSYRLAMDDLLKEDAQEMLRGIWTDPHSLDPAKKSAEVTRDIADRLAKIAKRLEKRHDPKDTAEFLMRCLFTMFAEDVDLLPHGGFEQILGQMKDTPDNFVPALESLWKIMDQGGYVPHLNSVVKRFNGSLFKNSKALPLEADEIHEMWVASKRDWKDVEPAIFGTLLERALNPKERSKLGAHYTPRAYVERLVVPTIIEPLREDWEMVQARIQDLHDEGNDKAALQVARDFHHKLCTTRVLDPACGTGNFLYVSLELMKKLEGEVLDIIESLGQESTQGGSQINLMMEGETVSPKQFFGLELNPRAVPIADLVLWIGYLKWQLRTVSLSQIAEPILHAYGTIKQQDAILAFDNKTLIVDETGKPLTRWDGYTKKLHPITGAEVPDPDSRVDVYSYENPKPAIWPEVEFIVGNPPFIGGKDMRAELGDGYAQACWKARPKVPGGADFVMQFWDEAALHLCRKGTKAKPNPLRRFGFITTNSITQTFSRRVIEKYTSAKTPLSLIYAVPDHPWMKASDKAAVRIAMTVAKQGEHEGILAEVVSSKGLNTDAPQVELEQKTGVVRANFMIGTDLSQLQALQATNLLSSKGVMLVGSGFIVKPEKAQKLGLGKVQGLDRHILKYCNGRDLAQKPRGVMVIDLYPLKIEDVRDRFPAVYQHVLETVRPEREQNNEEFRRQYWWWFGRRHSDLRGFLKGQSRYIATIETSKHRFFQFLAEDVRPDNKLVNIGLEKPDSLAYLSSRVHTAWSMATGGWLGVGNDSVYVKTKCFDSFPFPNCATDKSNLKLTEQIKALGERLDVFRKERLVAHDFLTMTSLLNVLERVRELDNGCPVEPLTEREIAIYDAGLIAVLKEIHDDIDRTTFEAYGWEDLVPTLVGKPGATTPSLHKSAEQEAAEEELLSRLVALNQERATEERQGMVRWLRPDYQVPKLGPKVPKPKEGVEIQDALTLTSAQVDTKLAWPKDGLEQIKMVRDILSKAQTPIAAEVLSANFSGRNTPKRKGRVADVLKTLVITGAARQTVEDAPRYFLPR
ncbi:class I SAM-dependent DNA methyltransferase [Pseudovibrio sp. WM33]|uniref:class I SAM-dependent DNA methyltransferase n=1 Tax=Pseudovibrio sp. WM33 TaxID=1735585 RepID=UPI0007AEA147|nr:DNA methyltransferase [Pseudovibrio sp. WM33]KZL19436.1 hypothetical protein PsWM33_04745 [Pseudovibrio sp. WM33]